MRKSRNGVPRPDYAQASSGEKAAYGDHEYIFGDYEAAESSYTPLGYTNAPLRANGLYAGT